MKYIKTINEGSDEKFTTYAAEKNGMKIEIGKSETWNFNWNGYKGDKISSDWEIYIDGKQLVDEFKTITDAKKFIKENSIFNFLS